MATVTDQATGLLKNLSLDSQSKTSESTNKTVNTAQNQPLDMSITPQIPDYMDPTVAYYPNAYTYYGGYDGTTNDWDNYSQYANTDGVDMSHGVYGDMYHGYGYAPYSPYSPATSPVPTVGHDGQMYQYPSPYFQPMTPTAVPQKGENAAYRNSNNAVNGVGVKGPTSTWSTTYQSPAYHANGYQDARYAFESPYSNGQARNNSNAAHFSNGNGVASRNQNLRPHTNVMSPRPLSGVNSTSGYMNNMYPNKLYSQYGSNYNSGYNYGSNAYNKYKPRGRGNGFFGYNNENGDGLNELNRGPRARTVKNQTVLTPVTLAVTEVKEMSVTPDREQYNHADFPETYENAKFFVIKSYSEDDVHKSIKYSVWASTQNGNKKLDAAYHEAQQKSGPCPVFLFFSVNTSGQFVGVAEMVGPVDFDKSLDYWQQDKWIGCFPLKWHIVKDMPNTLLKHIILENNENKPVTNSRDTQEVKLEQGLQIVKIFKEHATKQCILDDFEFYEDRQKRIQEKKAKQQQFQKQALEENVEIAPPKSSEISQENVKEATSAEKTVVIYGVADGC